MLAAYGLIVVGLVVPSGLNVVFELPVGSLRLVLGLVWLQVAICPLICGLGVRFVLLSG